jgi:NAD(P)H dehydrogenase (quinone)
MVIATTGASGKLGGKIAQRLAAAGAEQLLVGRDLARLPDLPAAGRRGPAEYADFAAMRAALAGADTLLLVSANLSGRRLEEHSAAIAAALAVGVQRVVYVSLLGAAPRATYVNARDHWQTEQYLAGTDVRYTVLRPAFYAAMLPRFADERGVIRGPAAGGRVSAVARDDIADVAAAILLDETDPSPHDGQVYEVTGPEAVTLDQAAAELTRAVGRTYSYQDETAAQSRAWRHDLGDTAIEVENRVSWFLAIAAGEAAAVTDVVADLTGHPARSIAANPDVRAPH